MLITVMLPSRGRPLSLISSLGSLLLRAAREIEFLVAIDPDDDLTLHAAVPEQLARTRFLVAPERYGYQRQQLYYNAMLPHARGDWLMVWGDDAEMRTYGWDMVIRKSKPAVLWPHANGPQHANCFPVVPASWARELGVFSRSAHPDTFWQHIGQHLGRHVKIPVEIWHNRHDLTGGHDDDTYREGRALLGPEGMADRYADPDAVAADARAIRCAGLCGS